MTVAIMDTDLNRTEMDLEIFMLCFNDLREWQIQEIRNWILSGKLYAFQDDGKSFGALLIQKP